MPRQLQGAQALMERMKTIAPIEKGGTGASTAAEAVQNLGGLSKDMIGQVGGMAQADQRGFIPSSILESMGLTIGYAITGPSSLVLGQTSIFRITNYNMLYPVSVSVSVGSYTLVGDEIHVLAPAVGTELTLTVGSRDLVLPLVDGGVEDPVILFPIEQTQVSAGSTFYTSEFIAGVATYSDWVEVSETEIIAAFPDGSAAVVCEGRCGEAGSVVLNVNGQNYGFGTSLTEREILRSQAATITITRSGTGSVRYRWVFPSSEHIATDWQIATDINFTNIVQESLNDMVNLTSWYVDMAPGDYYLRTKFHSSTFV
jgi:hypothetical protein